MNTKEDALISKEEDVTQLQEILQMPTQSVIDLTNLLQSKITTIEEDIRKAQSSLKYKETKISNNNQEIQQNTEKPHLVATVSEIFENDLQSQLEEDGIPDHADAQHRNKCVVIKTTKKETIFLPTTGLVDEKELKPGDFVCVNESTYVILEKLPNECDFRIAAMEIDEKPTDRYEDIGGLDKQIQEVIKAVILPITHKHMFDKIGICSPKGILMYGPPGTGKTLLARACAAETKSTFLKLACSQLVHKDMGAGAKLLRSVFEVAKEKASTIIFIDELDAIGAKRFNSPKCRDREVQRTMIELFNQLDGFNSTTNIKIIAATNRVDILDPALLRFGRLDRKVEFPRPDELARKSILQIHSRKMKVSLNVNYDKLARNTNDFNGAQCKAVCCEAGMFALRRNAGFITHEDYLKAVEKVKGRLQSNIKYYV